MAASQQRGRFSPNDSDEEEDDSFCGPRDGIRRNYYQPAPAATASSASMPDGANHRPPGEQPIRVQLNESYFGREKSALIGLLASARSKLSTVRMFNPTKNEIIRQQQQQTWTESEKYTLDSLNELKGTLDGQFQWTQQGSEREVWSSKLHYFLAITSYSIGLGNVIRFPILVQKNGGLAFIVPFVTMLIVEGIPLFYLELAIGQRMRKAAISCWNLVSPFAAGIGLASAAVSFIVGLYYNTMVAWTLLYLWNSANSGASSRPLPFSECPSDQIRQLQQQQQQQVLKSATTRQNETTTSLQSECQTAGSYQFYWFRQILDASDQVGVWGHFNAPVLFALLFAWILSYLCLARGLSSSKRLVYVASTFPYVILTIFFFKALTLRGMSDGIYYLFKPEWSRLADPYIWLQAAAQVFFSLGLGFGGLIALSSYNPINNNCYRDAIKVSLINFGTSLYAGIVIFAILGFKANLGVDKCLVERDQMIDFYLSDYNLKVLDYGSVFKQVIDDDRREKQDGPDIRALEAKLEDKNISLSDLDGNSQDYYDSSDAIASIRSLDKQLDLSSSSSSGFDYGDKDVEFIVDASSVISKEDLDKIIENIAGLPQCSVAKELDDATQGTGLVFVAMAEAISQFKDSTRWAIIFFLMLLTLGLDSQFGNLEGLLSSMADLNWASSPGKRRWLTGFICAISFAMSAVMFSHGAGSYMFAIFDEYAASFSLVLIALFELIAISYIYGLKRFCDDCELMTGKRPPFIIMLSWRYISPILLLITIFATLREFAVNLSYEAWLAEGRIEIRQWPAGCIVFGALLVIVCVLWIPGVAMLKIVGITLIPEENLNQSWLPAEELREFHDIQKEHQVTKLERVLFGFKSDDD